MTGAANPSYRYWMFPRPVRKLTVVPLELALVEEVLAEAEWSGQRNVHVRFEELLEQAGLKKTGRRRDGTGSGGRTHMAWLASLGLVFNLRRPSTSEDGPESRLFLTLAGEALARGTDPVPILTRQVMKHQFPSASYNGRDRRRLMDPRFKVRPFVFVLQLLLDPRIEGRLAQDEVAKLVITYGESNQQGCVEDVVSQILAYRVAGDQSLDDDFDERFSTSWEDSGEGDRFKHLNDIANTLFNWLEYTQLIERRRRPHLPGEIALAPSQTERVQELVNELATKKLIPHHTDEARFQQSYGLPPGKIKDGRDLWAQRGVSKQQAQEIRVQSAFAQVTLERPVTGVDSRLIHEITRKTGLDSGIVERVLHKQHPQGNLNPFLTKLNEYAQNGTKGALDFEKATVAVLREVFGLEAEHVGQKGRQPDIVIRAHHLGRSGIIDNKAITGYSISHADGLKMSETYIPYYKQSEHALAFFLYIANTFATGIDRGIAQITDRTGVAGSALEVVLFIRLIQACQQERISAAKIFDLFSVGRLIRLEDVEKATSS